MNIKSLAPLLILLLLGGVAYYYYAAEESSKNDLDQDWVMNIEDKDDVYRIFIADRKGEKADLVRDGEKWIYNDKFVANKYVMYNVLNALTQIRMKNRPAAAAIPHMVKTLAAHSTKVEVYGKNNKLLKAFYVGGVTPDERGTFMIMEGSNNPYVMHIPMAEVSLRHRFFTGERKWRDKTVLEFQAKDVASMSLEYPKQKNKSFTLKRQNGKWDVETFFPTTKKIDKPVNQDLVDSYLNAFKSVGAESIESDTEFIKKTISAKEFCILKVLFKDNTRQQVNFFPILKFESEDSDVPMDVEKYIAISEIEGKKTIYLTQQLVFKDVFWAYDFFF